MKISMIRAQCNRYTFQPQAIHDFVASKIEGTKILNLFAGKTILNSNEIRVDNDPTLSNIHFRMDVKKFLNTHNELWNTIIYDPPWNERKAKEKYDGRWIGKFTKLKDRIVEILKLNGIIISAGYEIDNFGKQRGMQLEEIAIINPSGEFRPFFITIERKKQKILEEVAEK